MLMSTQQGKGLLSNLLVWTLCFGSNQQLHQHYQRSASSETRLMGEHRRDPRGLLPPFTFLFTSDTVASGAAPRQLPLVDFLSFKEFRTSLDIQCKIHIDRASCNWFFGHSCKIHISAGRARIGFKLLTQPRCWITSTLRGNRIKPPCARELTGNIPDASSLSKEAPRAQTRVLPDVSGRCR